MNTNEEMNTQVVNNNFAKFQNIIPVIVNNEFINTVDMRNLHQVLEIKTQPSKWLERQLINNNDFIEGIDYTITEEVSVNGGSPKKLYHATIPTAKKVAMMTKTDRVMKFGTIIYGQKISFNKLCKEIKPKLI